MKLILHFLKPHRKLCLVTVLMLIIDVAGALIIPTLAAQMLNLGTADTRLDQVIATGIQMLVVCVISGVCAIASGYACATLSARLGKDLRMALYEKSLKLSVYDFRQFGIASMTTRTISDITTIQFAFQVFMQLVVPVPIIFVIALVLSFSLNVQMGILLLAVIAIVLVLAVFIIRTASPLFRRLQKLLDRMSTVLLENITGVRVLRAFNNEGHEQSRMDTAFKDYADTSIKANRRFAHLDGISFLFINIFIVLVYWLSGAQISMGNFQIGDITAVIEYALLALFYIMMAEMVILILPRALECCSRIDEVLTHSPEIVDPAESLLPDPTADTVLRFDDVTFRFADAEENTLSHISFDCRRGETTAIIGGTGSGKSTIASLILRFHDVSWGRICFEGVDIRSMTQKQLRDTIAYVQQKAWLFSGTIRENLCYSNKDATDACLMHAADIAQAGDFIRSLPEGLDAPVAQGGTNFSGGQKQRLSIARALVKKPALYIFDDSFSALDFKTDAALRRALADETKEAAVLIIAQRVSTIRHADRIIVLNEGRMAGIGTHEDLMASCPVYQEIYDSQTKEADEA